MNHQLYAQARLNTHEIIEASKNLMPEHVIVFKQTALRYEPLQVWDGWAPYTKGLHFGSYPLNKKEVKRIIDDDEYIAFLMS